VRSRPLAVVAVVALAGLAGACAGARAPAAPGADPRVVSLHEVTSEVIVALGAGGRLVGVSEPVDPSPALRRALAAVPRVDGLESILAARPTVVLGLATVAEQSPELVAALRAHGVEVWLGDPATLDDVHELVRQVAARVGAVTAGAALVADLERRERAATAPAGAPVRVFVYDCCDPPFTAGGRTVLTDLVARAGGVNVFADLDADWAHVSWEEAAARAPALLVIHAYAWDGQGDVAAKRAALARVPGWRDLPVVVLPLGEALGGLRSVDGLERLRAGLAGGRR
jgi:iron complex transport system substrate-binding protein